MTFLLTVAGFLAGVWLGYWNGRADGHRDGVRYLRRRAMACRGDD